MSTPTDDMHAGGNGSRAVTNSDLQKELRILKGELTAKLDLMLQSQSYSEKALEQTRIDVQKNAADILTLRDHAHLMANTLTKHEGLAAILSNDTARELVQHLPYITSTRAMLERRGLQDVMTPKQLALVQTMERELDEDKVKALASEVARHQKHAARWFELPREVVAGIIGVLGLVFATHLDPIWHAFFH